MSDPQDLQDRILERLASETYRRLKPSGLARELQLDESTDVDTFRRALKALMQSGQIVRAVNGSLMLQAQPKAREKGKDQFTGTYRHNKRGFGFVVPTDPEAPLDVAVGAGTGPC